METNDYNLHNGRIKIVDGEQFVPLFLALPLPATSVLNNPTVYRGFVIEREDRDAIDTIPSSNDLLYAEEVSAICRKSLLKTYSVPIPVEYSLSVPPSGRVLGSLIDLPSAFGGTRDVCFPYSSKYYSSTLGLLIREEISSPYSILTTRRYQSVTITPQNVTLCYPLLLLVVKAKYIGYIRTCIGLRMREWNLPINALKLIKTNTTSNDEIAKYLQKDPLFNDFIKAQDPIVEYSEPKTITNKYLYKPMKIKGAEQYLSDAIYALEHKEVLQEVL